MKMKRFALLALVIFLNAFSSGRGLELFRTVPSLESDADNGKIYSLNDTNGDARYTGVNLSGVYANPAAWPGFASDLNHDYFYNPSSGVVNRHDLNGSGKTKVMDMDTYFSDTNAWKGFAADQNYFYFMNTGPASASISVGDVYKIRKDGSTAHALFQGNVAGGPIANPDFHHGFATDGFHFYLFNSESLNNDHRGMVRRVDMDGSRPVDVVQIEPDLVSEASHFKGMAQSPIQLNYRLGACQWIGKPIGEMLDLIDAMEAAGVKWLWLNLNTRGNFNYVKDCILRCNQYGIKVVLKIPQKDPSLFVNGAVERSGTDPFGGSGAKSAYRLSDLDLNKAEDYVRDFLNLLVESPRGEIDAIQVANEVNSIDFNGDLDFVDGSAVYSASNPPPVQFMEGIDKLNGWMIRTKDAAFDILGKRVVLIPTGLVNAIYWKDASWFQGRNWSAVDQGYNVQLLADGIAEFDVVAMHVYPGDTDTVPSTAVASSYSYIKSAADPLIPHAQGKPFWFMEGGYHEVSRFGGDELKRRDKTVAFLHALNQYHVNDYPIGMQLLFAFSDYVDASTGELLPAGEVFSKTSYPVEVWYYLENEQYNQRLKSDGGADVLDLTNDTGDRVQWKVEATNVAGYYFLENRQYTTKRLRAQNGSNAFDVEDVSGNKVKWRMTTSPTDAHYYLENYQYSGERLKSDGGGTVFDLTNDTGKRVRWSFVLAD